MSKLAENKKALHDYEIMEKFEAGMVLRGYEVKAVRGNLMNLKGSYVSFDSSGGLSLKGAHIGKYPQAGPLPSYDPYQVRKLLLNKNEINNLRGKLAQKGLTLVPISVYNRNNRIKIELGLAKGKKAYDKRATLKKRDLDREIRQEF